MQDRLFLEDIVLSDISKTNSCAGLRNVTTNLFGKKSVYKLCLQKLKKMKSRRLFICTNPDAGVLFLNYIKDKAICAMGQAIPET